MNCGLSTTGSALGSHLGGAGSSPAARSTYISDKEEKLRIKNIICENHYAHSFPSGKTYCFRYEDAIVAISIPANNQVSTWLVGEKNRVWELSRLWAPSPHRFNLLTEAISRVVEDFKKLEPEAWALISYADPNTQGHNGYNDVPHEGLVYKAASWASLGRSEDGRYFRHGTTGQVVARRKFHMGKKFILDSEIIALGYVKQNLPGKLRFGRGLTHKGRRIVARRAAQIAAEATVNGARKLTNRKKSSLQTGAA